LEPSQDNFGAPFRVTLPLSRSLAITFDSILTVTIEGAIPNGGGRITLKPFLNSPMSASTWSHREWSVLGPLIPPNMTLRGIGDVIQATQKLYTLP
jgi:hypothetical protein